MTETRQAIVDAKAKLEATLAEFDEAITGGVASLRKLREDGLAELKRKIADEEADLRQLRADRDERRAELEDVNRALGLRADGTPKKQREAKTDAADSASV